MKKSDEMKIQLYLASHPDLYNWITERAKAKGLNDSAFVRMKLIEIKNKEKN